MSNGDIVAAGIIVSRYENEAWKRSSCQMVVQEDVMMMSNCFSLAEAISAASGMSIDTINELYLNNAGVGGIQSTNSGGGSNPSVVTPTANNTVSITASGATASQDVSGGSVSKNAPITKVEVTGTGLDQLSIKAGTTNNEAAASALTLSDGNTKATWSGNESGSALYFFKEGALWFTLTILPHDDSE